MFKNLMCKHLNQILLMLLFPLAAIAAENDIDLSGDWLISSSVGGQTPITVHCKLVQKAKVLSGSCTPEMENPESSELTGVVEGGSASWGYKVVFNGNPGTVDFIADSISSTNISGTLSLSGTAAPFQAAKE